MNRFTADYSSSPAGSDPGTPPPTLKGPPLFGNISNVSTTPAGPPPSSTASFTPGGAPPSSTFSRFGTGTGGGGTSKPLFPKYNQVGKPAPSKSSGGSAPLLPRTKNGTPAKPKNQQVSFPPMSGRGGKKSPPGWGTGLQQPGHDDSMAMEEEDEEEDDEEDEEDAPPGDPAFRGFTSLNPGFSSRPPQNTLIKSSMGACTHPQPKPVTRKKNLIPKPSQLPRKGKEDLIPGIARDLAAQSTIAKLTEPDVLILQTEEIMQVFSEEIGNMDGRETRQRTSSCALDLIRLWRKNVRPEASSISSIGIGPPETATGFEKANYLASLLLTLHHPPIVQDSMASRRPALPSKALISISEAASVPVPQILLDWLDNYHVSYRSLFQAVLSASPNCTAHDYFWDAVQCLSLRAKLREVMHLFAQADFKYAVTAKDDGADTPGYHGAQLQAIHGVINRARQVLDGCPGTRNGDWQVDNADWDLYRKRVTTELEYLSELADGEEVDEDEDAFRADNFGILKSGGSLLDRTKRADSVPWTVYQNLKVMYSIILGSADEIISQSQDWLEAATSLTVWWDGSEDDSIAKWSMNVSDSQRAGEKAASVDPYLSRLRAAFLCVTDPDDQESLQINTMSPVEVGLGAVLQGDSDSVLRILQTQSLCIAAEVAELGAFAGWLTSTGSKTSGLDPEDLMVLSYAAAPSDITQDEILLSYAEALFDRRELQGSDSKTFEGWELALSVASRFDDQELTHSTTSEFLDQLDLDSQQRMDKLVSLCSALGLEEEAQKVCEKFADHLVNNTTSYGTALLCYARSHASHKLRQVMDLLVSYCLVQSKAYPVEEEMDENLQALVASPKAALAGLADVDPAAAEMLQFYLVGYACIRRFYNLRDEELSAVKANGKPAHRPLARRRLAAKALVAAINSAADSIYGGLYDAERQSAIQVDGLLTLLGEATPFLASGHEKRVLTSTQMYSLLAAVEDLQTVNSRVYDATEECLQAALRNYHGSLPPSPHAMLKKSVSSGTNSNFSFSMMGSEMLARSGESAGGKSLGSAVLVGSTGQDAGERGWDWRAQFKDKGSQGVDVLRFLRMGIARELSLAELEDGE